MRGSALVLKFAPFDRFGDPQSEPGWGTDVESVALVEDLGSFSVAYKVHPEDDWAKTPTSKTGNSSEVALPWAVQLEIEADEEQWPPVIVAFEQYGERL